MGLVSSLAPQFKWLDNTFNENDASTYIAAWHKSLVMDRKGLTFSLWKYLFDDFFYVYFSFFTYKPRGVSQILLETETIFTFLFNIGNELLLLEENTNKTNKKSLRLQTSLK